jgi:O-antigen/teichoic acid export membrane protein
MISGAAGYVAPMIVNLIATPILINILGEASFGIQSLFNVIIGYFMVADMGMDIPITKFVAENNINNAHQENSKLLSSTFQIYSLIGMAGALVLWGLAAFLSTSLFEIPQELTDDATLVFKFAGLGFLFSTINMWGRATLNGLHRYDLSNGVNTLAGVLGTVTGLIAIYYQWGVVGFVFCKVLFSFLSSGLYFILIKQKVYSLSFTFGINHEIWLKIKNYIGNGLVVRISGMILGKMDQTLIGIWLGVALAGIYSIPFLIPSTLCYFTANMITFIFPVICELHATNKKKELQELFLNYSRIVSLISSFIFLPLLLFGERYLAIWVGETIAEKTSVLLIILSLSFFITTLCVVLPNLFMIGIGQMKIYTRFTLIKGLITLAGLLAFIKPFGINGAGLAILIASLCDTVFFIFTVKNHVTVDFREIAGVYLKPILISVLVGGVCLALKPLATSLFLFILLNLAFLLLYGVAVYVFQLLKPREKAFILDFFRFIKKTKVVDR